MPLTTLEIEVTDDATSAVAPLLAPEPPLTVGGLRRALLWALAVMLTVVAITVACRARSATRDSDCLPLFWAWIDIDNFVDWTLWPRMLVPPLLLLAWLKLGGPLARRGVVLRAAVFVLFVLAVNVSTALIDGGPYRLVRPFDNEHEFFHDVRLVQCPRQFFHDYPSLIGQLSLHTRTHPPGAVVFLWLGAKLFGPGLWVAAVWAVTWTALAGVPFYLLALRLAGRRVAHVAAALYLVTPNLVLYGATSMDGVYVGPLCLAVLFFRYALDAKRRMRAITWAALAGVTLAGAMLLTYATVCVGLAMTLFAAVSFVANRDRPRIVTVLLTIGAAFAACQVGQFFALGYDPVKSLRASYEFDRYLMKSHALSVGEYLDVSTTNLFAFLAAAGLLTSALFAGQFWRDLRATWVRRPPADLWTLSFGLTLLVLAFIRMFTFETERVWTFLAPLVVLPVAVQLCRRTDDEPAWRGWGYPKTVVVFLLITVAQTVIVERFIETQW